MRESLCAHLAVKILEGCMSTQDVPHVYFEFLMPDRQVSFSYWKIYLLLAANNECSCICIMSAAVVMLNARVRFGEGAAEAVFDINCGAHIRRGASTCARSRTCAGSVIRASE